MTENNPLHTFHILVMGLGLARKRNKDTDKFCHGSI
jgi:hypothetical protein